MSTVDPGPGYRLLELKESRVGSEFTKDGGLHWQTVEEWELNQWPMLTRIHFPHRIRIVDPGIGYRLLNLGEPRRGSEFKPVNGTWTAVNDLNASFDPVVQKTHYPHRILIQEQPTEAELPAVAGRMEMTHADFQRACRVAIGDEEAQIHQDNGLIHLLCEAIRCSREAVELAKQPGPVQTECEHRWHPASEPPSSTDAKWVVLAVQWGFKLWQNFPPNPWPPETLKWFPLLALPEPDDGFKKWWATQPPSNRRHPDYRTIDGMEYHIAPVRIGWQAALAAQKANP